MADLIAASELHFYPGCTAGELEQVLDEALQAKFRPTASAAVRRRHGRHAYVAHVLMEIPELEELKSRIGDARIVLHVATRNLSRSGVSVVLPAVLLPAPESGLRAPLRSSRIITAGLQVRMAMPVKEGDRLWMVGEIVRTRALSHGFLEAGVRFTGKAAGETQGVLQV